MHRERKILAVVITAGEERKWPEVFTDLGGPCRFMEVVVVVVAAAAAVSARPSPAELPGGARSIGSLTSS